MLSVGQESAPKIDRVDASNLCPPPGTKLAVDIDCSISSYPVLLWGSYIFWPLSYIDNRVSMAIVQTNTTGAIIKTVEATGARYINSIQVDTANKRVAFVGQAEMVATLSWTVLLATPSINLGQFAPRVQSGKKQSLNGLLQCTPLFVASPRMLAELTFSNGFCLPFFLHHLVFSLILTVSEQLFL
jgi:hypothetical protein